MDLGPSTLDIWIYYHLPHIRVLVIGILNKPVKNQGFENHFSIRYSHLDCHLIATTTCGRDKKTQSNQLSICHQKVISDVLLNMVALIR